MELYVSYDDPNNLMGCEDGGCDDCGVLFDAVGDAQQYADYVKKLTELGITFKVTVNG